MPARKREHAVGMVAVLVSDEDGGDVGRREADAREAPLGALDREAAVDQDAGRAGLGDQAVTGAAAAERCEPQLGLGYFS